VSGGFLGSLGSLGAAARGRFVDLSLHPPAVWPSVEKISQWGESCKREILAIPAVISPRQLSDNTKSQASLPNRLTSLPLGWFGPSVIRFPFKEDNDESRSFVFVLKQVSETWRIGFTALADWAQPCWLLNLLKPWLAESLPTVIIPFDDCVIFVGLFNCAQFPRRLSEVAQTLDAISGIQFLLGSRGSASGGFLARSESGVAPAYDTGGWGALCSLGIGFLVIWVIFLHCEQIHVGSIQ
jgi:hypothetical protein